MGTIDERSLSTGYRVERRAQKTVLHATTNHLSRRNLQYPHTCDWAGWACWPVTHRATRARQHEQQCNTAPATASTFRLTPPRPGVSEKRRCCSAGRPCSTPPSTAHSRLYQSESCPSSSSHRPPWLSSASRKRLRPHPVRWRGDRAALRVAMQLVLPAHLAAKQEQRGRWAGGQHRAHVGVRRQRRHRQLRAARCADEARRRTE